MNDIYFNKLKNNFLNIINDNYNLNYNFNNIVNNNFNFLIYSIYGFPIELLVDEIIKKKYNLNYINKIEYQWEKCINYYENPHFIEINLINPNITKNKESLTKFILNILKNKPITSDKHLIIIKNIDIFKEHFSVLKILLEIFSKNAYFICTTYKMSVIENAIISRFTNIRIPLFQNIEIQNIFDKYFNKKLNKYLIENNTRNLTFSIFISNVEDKEPHLINEEFCKLKYPPFINIFNKKNNIEDIRKISYNCFQYNVTIKDIISDWIIINKINNIKIKKSFDDIVKYASDLEHKLTYTNKGREAIFIELLLCHILL